MKRARTANLLLGALLVMGASTTSAQDQGGRRGNFDPAEMRQRMMDQFKESLGASDEEWKAIQPRLEKVMEKQRGTAVGGMMAFGAFGRSGRGGEGGGPGGGRVRGGGDGGGFPEAEALRQAVESGTNEEIKTKLAAYRDARKKREDELKAAREDLRKISSVKQEAAFVARGILD